MTSSSTPSEAAWRHNLLLEELVTDSIEGDSESAAEEEDEVRRQLVPNKKRKLRAIYHYDQGFEYRTYSFFTDPDPDPGSGSRAIFLPA